MRNKLIAISCVYNVAPYIRKCIESVVHQDYDNFEYLIIEDNSTDGTREIVREMQEIYGFRVHYNEERLESPVGNFAKGIQLSEGGREDIFVTVDGDDWLFDNTVFSYLNEVYSDPNIWLTYGQFISASGAIRDYCKPLKDTRNYRKSGQWVTSHLRTIKRKLWDRIRDKDLRDNTGKYYVYYPDLAYVLPAVEIAGVPHIKFIDKILYVYNDLSPLCSANDWQTKKEQMKYVYGVAKEIRSKPVYTQLKDI